MKQKKPMLLLSEKLNILWAIKFAFVIMMLGTQQLRADDSKSLEMLLQNTITGMVTDDTGVPLPGANIVVKGTTIGTQSDFDGNYSIETESDAILVFSYIGFTPQEIELNGQTVVNVSLSEDASKLDEVVVVGYGTQRKADLTGAVSAIKGEKLTKAAPANLALNLAGKLTGVIAVQNDGRPGADDPTFLIRGQSTFGDNSALVLIDGIERPISRIDPNDIESMTILKDAASAAVYGAKGANGVILVTTKRGSEKGTTIEYSTSYGVQSPTFLPQYMNAGEYAQYFNEARINSGQEVKFTPEQVSDFQNGSLPSTDWWAEVMGKSASVAQHNVSISGGGEATKFFVSLGYLNQDGLYETSGAKRYNIRSNLDTKVSENFSIGLNLAARQFETSGSPSGDYLHTQLNSAQPTQPAYVPEEFRIDPYGLNYNGTAVSPIGEAIRSGYDRDRNKVFESTLFAQYNFPFAPGLNTKVSFSSDHAFNQNKTFTTPYTVYFYDRNTGLSGTSPSTSLTTLTQASEETVQNTLQASLNYQRDFGKHSVSGLLLYEQIESDRKFQSAYREGFLSTKIDQLFAGSDTNKNNFGEASESARIGYVARVTYNFDDRYLLQANVRYDGSYNFPKDSRWGVFPAFSAGWRISQEQFMEGVDFIDNLKIRASWGQYGNDKVDPFLYLFGYEFGSGSVIGSQYRAGIGDTGIPNPNITWETATNSNIGFEYALFNGKFSGEFDYFKKRTDGILITRSASIPLSFGAQLSEENLGIVDNSGFESIMRYRTPIGGLNLTLEGNVTYAKSEVVYIDEPIEVEDRLRKTGLPFNQRFGLQDSGLFQSQQEIDAWADQDGIGNTSLNPGDIKYLDFNNDGRIDSEDIHKIGKSATPELIFGFNINLNYKNLDFAVNFQGASNYDNYRLLNSFQLEQNSRQVLIDSWRVGNENAKYPRTYVGQPANNQQVSTFWLENGFYVKMRNVELSYTIPEITTLQKMGVDILRLSVSGNNLLTFAKNTTFDPESTNINYPINRTISLGLSVQF